MNFDVISDIHLEFADYIFPAGKLKKSPYLLIAGDTMLARQKPIFYHYFFEKVASIYEKVFVIVGNHEFYGLKWDAALEKLRAYFFDFPNIYFLENTCVQLPDDHLIIGSSLWTSFDNKSPISMIDAERTMSDYRHIMVSEKDMLTAEFIYDYHKKCMRKINCMLGANPNKKVIMLTHTAPSTLSINEKYATKANRALNFAFVNDLSDFIQKHPNIKAWVHGHTHDPVSYDIGSTKVVCNPRGYPSESNFRNYQPIQLEV